MARRRRRTTNSRTTVSTRRVRRTRSPRKRIDLGPRPVLTAGVWLALSFGIGFLGYAILGNSTWSDDMLAMIPVKFALLSSFALFAFAAYLYAGMQFGWFGSPTEPQARRARRSTPRTTRRTRRRSSTR